MSLNIVIIKKILFNSAEDAFSYFDSGKDSLK